MAVIRRGGAPGAAPKGILSRDPCRRVAGYRARPDRGHLALLSINVINSFPRGCEKRVRATTRRNVSAHQTN